MYATDYFEKAMLGLMDKSDIQAPEKVYLALFMSDPGDDGTSGYEVNYNGYQRQQIIFSTPADIGNGSMSMQNENQIDFTEAPVNVGTINYVGVMDSPNGGNMLLYGQLDTVLNIQQGVTPIFRPGNVKWTWSGNLGTYYRRAIMETFRGTTCAKFQPYVGFCNGDPDRGTGAEFAGFNYARVPVTMSVPEQQPNGTALSVNVNEVLSNEASDNWGTMSYVCIYDAEINGNIYAVIPLGTAFLVGKQTSVGFHPGSLRFSVN